MERQFIKRNTKNQKLLAGGALSPIVLDYIMDQLSDKKNKEENWVQNLALQDAVARLNERERQIIRMRFYEGQTQMEVAREIGISQAQVSRLEKSALRSMRNYLSDER